MYNHILVPVDESMFSVRTVSHAVDYAQQIGASITFFHAVPDYTSTGEGALMHAMDPEAIQARMIGRSRSILAKAELAAGLCKVPCGSRYQISDRPYEAILEVADDIACDLIFMASHGRSMLSRLMVGSQTMKVLAQAKVPVLVDTSETNSGNPMISRALGIIQDEHRTLGVLLTEFLRLVQEIGDRHVEPDFQVLQGIVYYFREFPLRLHHPKEEAYLFSAMRSRCPEVESTLTTLEAQHHQEPSLISGLEGALNNYKEIGTAGFARFATDAEAYAKFVWGHLKLEEREILPAAKAHLKDEDWQEIAQAFSENGDPRFDQTQEEAFRDLIARILSRIPATRPVGDSQVR